MAVWCILGATRRITSPSAFKRTFTERVCVCRAVKNGKNGKPHVLTLQDLEDDNLQFDISAETLEELFEWYQAAWDITQRTISNEYKRQHEVSISRSVSRRLCRSVHVELASGVSDVSLSNLRSDSRWRWKRRRRLLWRCRTWWSTVSHAAKRRTASVKTHKCSRLQTMRAPCCARFPTVDLSFHCHSDERFILLFIHVLSV